MCGKPKLVDAKCLVLQSRLTIHFTIGNINSSLGDKGACNSRKRVAVVQEIFAHRMV